MLPAAFLAGMPVGFLLVAEQPPAPLIDELVKLLTVASGSLIAAALILPGRLPLKETVSTGALMGGCPGYVHGAELGQADRLGFSLGFLATSTVLLMLGLAIGLASGRLR